MSDFNSSLPIRTESNGDAAIKIVDGAIPSQELTVNADGSLNITDNGASITVDAVDLDIRDLDSAQDSVEVLQATHDNLNANANIQVGDADVANGNPVPVSDAGGSLTVDAIDLDIRDLTHVSDSVKVGDGTDLLAVNADGSINVVVVSEQDGTEVVDYQTTVAVAGGGSTNHDYTVPGGVTFYGEEIWASASGKIKVSVLVNAAPIYVAFNSTANPNIRIPLEHLVKAAATQVVRITITNLDNQSQDVYSTLLGVTK